MCIYCVVLLALCHAVNNELAARRTLTAIDLRDGCGVGGHVVVVHRAVGHKHAWLGMGFQSAIDLIAASAADRSHQGAGLVVGAAGALDGVAGHRATGDIHAGCAVPCSMTDDGADGALGLDGAACDGAVLDGHILKDGSVRAVVAAGYTNQAARPVSALDSGIDQVAVFKSDNLGGARLTNERTDTDIFISIVFVNDDIGVLQRQALDDAVGLARPGVRDQRRVQPNDFVAVAVDGQCRCPGCRLR